MKKIEQIVNRIAGKKFLASIMVVAGEIPANACIFNISNKLDGAITPSCIKKFESALSEIKKFVDNENKIKELEDTLRITKAKYTANFLSILAYWGYSPNPKQVVIQEKIEKIYKELYDYCTGSEVYKELTDMVVSFMEKNSIDFVGEQNDMHGPVLVFEYKGQKWHLPHYRAEFLSLFRRGSHQIELLRDTGNDHWFDLFKVRGGVRSIVKVIKEKSNGK